MVGGAKKKSHGMKGKGIKEFGDKIKNAFNDMGARNVADRLQSRFLGRGINYNKVLGGGINYNKVLGSGKKHKGK
jgi:hypothetical protein